MGIGLKDLVPKAARHVARFLCKAVTYVVHNETQQPPVLQWLAKQSAVIRRESEHVLSRFACATFRSRGPFWKTKNSTHD